MQNKYKTRPTPQDCSLPFILHHSSFIIFRYIISP
jgi:hypothetical protein